MSGGPGGPGAPRCVIVEQPASKALRFRYECEGRSAGSIPGVNSTADNKTYPTIQIEGYKGRAVVVVSCVTKDPPYRPHPHSLVGKEGCKKGVCTMEVNTETMTLSFANLGIQCIKKKDIDAALAQRKDLRIDPFKTGFGHRNQPGTIDLNAVRLCFQSFLEGEKNQFNRPIMPVVSEPIYDKKAMSDLVICKLSEVSASVIGGKEIILLCEKVAKEDISVRLYEELNGQVLWEGQCDFQPTEVHKQVAISFRTPKYKDIQVTQPVKVMIQLLRPSDKATSEPRPFLLTPIESDSVGLPLGRRKRPKTSNAELDLLKDSVAKMMQQSLAEVKPEIKHELGDAAVANTSSAPFGMQMMYPPTGGAHGPGGPVRKVSPVSVYASPGASPDYMAAPAPAPAYTVMGVAAPSQQHVYPPHPSPFSPASQGVASPAEHQASVSPLPQFGHPLEQINNLNMMQQHNIDNNLNIIQQQQHSPMQHNIDNMMQQQLSPMQHNIDNMMQQQHSPLQHNIDNMMQQQHSPLQHNIDNMMQQQHSPIQYNMIQQQQQHNIDNMAQQSHNIDNMAQQSHNIDNGHVVMDMDTQQHSIELSAGRLDSRELRELDLDGLDTVNENLSANLSASLRLNDASNSDGMTDSLSRIPSTSLIYYPNNNTTITTNNNNNNNNGNSFPNTDGGNQF